MKDFYQVLVLSFISLSSCGKVNSGIAHFSNWWKEPISAKRLFLYSRRI